MNAFKSISVFYFGPLMLQLDISVETENNTGLFLDRKNLKIKSKHISANEIISFVNFYQYSEAAITNNMSYSALIITVAVIMPIKRNS